MKWRECLVNLFYRAATGSRGIRNLLTPFGALFFVLMLALLVFASFRLDRFLGWPEFPAGFWTLVLCVLFLAKGLFLWLWSLVCFIKAGGTPVPFNPPPRLLTDGPYAWVRNPMISGVFCLMFGVGFLLKSPSLVFFFTPAFILISVLELKIIEEPELEKRLGREYLEYRKMVPMFFPWGNKSPGRN
ncbi:MAG: isoprenylcysteine carboxylmethyltransferase family protein [bacterium]